MPKLVIEGWDGEVLRIEDIDPALDNAINYLGELFSIQEKDSFKVNKRIEEILNNGK